MYHFRPGPRDGEEKFLGRGLNDAGGEEEGDEACKGEEEC